MELSPFWEYASRSATQEIPNFYGIRRFFVVLVRAVHWSYPEPDESIPYHLILFQLRSFLILSSYLRLSLLSSVFLSGFPTKILCSVLYFPMHAIFLAQKKRDRNSKCRFILNVFPYKKLFIISNMTTHKTLI
jgi:hypothetical protein